MIAREQIVAAVRAWIGTPYHHRSRIKGVGCDCGQLPIAVYASVGLIPPINPDYAQQWMLHRHEEQYLGWVRRFAKETDHPTAGDFAIWRFGRTFSHGAIVVDPPRIIHACSGARAYFAIIFW